jgi:hypothetical protein
MHGMSDTTPRTSDTPAADDPRSIFTAAWAAQSAFESAYRHADKLRASGKWGRKYAADLNRCRVALVQLTAAVEAVRTRFHDSVRAELKADAAGATQAAQPGAGGTPRQQQDGDHSGWAASPVERYSREAIAAEILGSLSDDDGGRDAMGRRQIAQLNILAGMPSANVGDVAVKLAHVVHNQTIHRLPSGFPGETAEYCLAVSALADLVLLRSGEVRPEED